MAFRFQRNPNDLFRELRLRIQFWLAVLLIIAGTGVWGYRTLEHVSWLEAAYKTVCVLLTLGLPTPPANPAATAFTIVLAIAGIGSFAYAAGAIARHHDFGRLSASLLAQKGVTHHEEPRGPPYHLRFRPHQRDRRPPPDLAETALRDHRT